MTNPPPATAGNRLPLGEGVRSQHFLYKTTGFPLEPLACGRVISAAKSWVRERPLYPGQVALALPETLDRPTRVALLRLLEPVLKLTCLAVPRVDLTITHQAFPHVDSIFAGSSFLSRVLHTGPYPYAIETLHTQKQADGVQALMPSSRVVSAGDWFVFDPTTAHLAAPLKPSHSNLLVLLQFELRDQEMIDRERILQELPPLEGDGDESPITYRLPRRRR